MNTLSCIWSPFLTILPPLKTWDWFREQITTEPFVSRGWWEFESRDCHPFLEISSSEPSMSLGHTTSEATYHYHYHINLNASQSWYCKADRSQATFLDSIYKDNNPVTRSQLSISNEPHEQCPGIVRCRLYLTRSLYIWKPHQYQLNDLTLGFTLV